MVVVVKDGVQELLDVWFINVQDMVWVFNSIDKDSTTYKDFVAILKTYTYRHSSLPYMFVYILVTFTFGY